MNSDSAIDLVTKILGALAAVLGTAGYVLILGAAILWLRLTQVDLPPEVPVSLASRQELIATGAQAVAVWVLLVAALGGLAAWIVAGNPDRRRFGYAEAGLALAMTVSTLLALDSGELWILALPLVAGLVVLAGTLFLWPSLDAVAAVLVPVAVGSGLAVSLSYLSKGNGIATAAGATCIFGVLVLVAPWLQRWRARQERNDKAVERVKAVQTVEEGEVDPLVAALERSPSRSVAVTWIGRIALGSLMLVALGAVAVAAQVDRGEDFHQALVSLTNGDCIEGTYIARGSDQVVLAEPNLDGTEDKEDEAVRITTIPVKEVLEVQVYGDTLEGVPLSPEHPCDGDRSVLVHPPSPNPGPSPQPNTLGNG